MKKMEKIQYRALRLVYYDFDSSYEELRSKTKKQMLYVQRLRLIMCEVYKCINGLGPSYLHGLFKIKENGYDQRKLFMLEQPKYNTIKHGKHSIRYQGAKLWNNLENMFKEADKFKKFKTLISNWDGPHCNCSVCEMCSLGSL